MEIILTIGLVFAIYVIYRLYKLNSVLADRLMNQRIEINAIEAERFQFQLKITYLKLEIAELKIRKAWKSLNGEVEEPINDTPLTSFSNEELKRLRYYIHPDKHPSGKVDDLFRKINNMVESNK